MPGFSSRHQSCGFSKEDLKNWGLSTKENKYIVQGNYVFTSKNKTNLLNPDKFRAKDRNSRISQNSSNATIFSEFKRNHPLSGTNSGCMTNCSSPNSKKADITSVNKSFRSSLTKHFEFPKINSPAPIKKRVIRRLNEKDFFIKRTAYEILEDDPQHIAKPYFVLKDLKASKVHKYKNVQTRNLKYKKNELVKRYHSKIYTGELDKYAKHKLDLFIQRKVFQKNTSLRGIADISMAFLSNP
ncbi:unnamed protein product [Moneuplotes crassus]|uniref:Uncharacterized protein n=1 Tax=Euplotes crassus TaxID=5936 RepID=A0AAD2D0Y2_EUPCR|nr:unnamed protein product [Moneuplotes crassus]